MAFGLELKDWIQNLLSVGSILVSVLALKLAGRSKSQPYLYAIHERRIDGYLNIHNAAIDVVRSSLYVHWALVRSTRSKAEVNKAFDLLDQSIIDNDASYFRFRIFFSRSELEKLTSFFEETRKARAAFLDGSDDAIFNSEQVLEKLTLSYNHIALICSKGLGVEYAAFDINRSLEEYRATLRRA